ncbi:S-antigen protein (macronuclear) [Tetrahymena thermophila SB210]|uniref:S-antigen protein n=1 Tax=Tetrahymena thermophila (strain SB210) TaxID=312017 RepID=W7XBB1_TETTS|nr:S-antigen protein [Tetrahymena thermophila SB210]EWS70961.1 S-antigen protein [Tetrahymena thermophila SB210]|eukprot:XP_012656517.1 S-antigen protein [Tetrahymena thermophila SB210]
MQNQQYSQQGRYDLGKTKNNMQTALSINNRYQDIDDSIFIDPQLNDLRTNLIAQREYNQTLNILNQNQNLPLQNVSQTSNLQKNQTFQRNYIIYQPQTAFLSDDAPSDWGNGSNTFPEKEDNFQQISQRFQDKSFINDTECKDLKKSKLQHFVKSSDIWREDSSALLNILNEKREELRVFYIKQEEKVQHFFFTLEKVLSQEKSNMIYSIQESLKMNINQVDAMVKQLQTYQEECDKLKEDIALNFTDIIEEMRNEPFNEILKMYTQKLNEFELYTKKSCQSVHMEILTLDFVGASMTTNLPNKWETSFKNNYINKTIQFNTQYANLMKDNLLKPLAKNSSRDKQCFQQTLPHQMSQCQINQTNKIQSQFNLSSGFQQSNSSLSINSKRSNRSASLIQGGNQYFSNNSNTSQVPKSSLQNIQNLIQNNLIDIINPSANINVSNRSNDNGCRNVSQQNRSFKNNSILNTSDQLSNSSQVQLNNSSLNLNKTASLAQKIKTQTIKNSQVQNPQKKKTNSVYTNVLKNMSKNFKGLQLDTSKSVNSQNKIMFTTTNATKKFIDLERNNIENINTINFNFK